MDFDGLQGTIASLVNEVQKYMESKYSTDLKSYKVACLEDSTLKTFNSSLQQKTKGFIGSLSNTQSLSPESLAGVFRYLSDVDQNALKVIIESKEDVWKNKDLRSLVKSYFESTSKTLDLCNTIEKCVEKTESGQLIIRIAVKKFEAESRDTNHLGENSKKYAKTFEELKKYKAMGDPFSGEFSTQFKSVYEQQVLLLEELRKQREKLDNKEGNAKARRIVWNVIFGTAFVSVLVLWVYLLLMGVAVPPPLLAVSLGSLYGAWNWVSNKYNEYEKGLKKQKYVLSKMEAGAEVNFNATESIYKEVESLRTSNSSILKTVDFMLERNEDEEAIRLSMEKLKKDVDGFTEKIKEVGENAAKYSKLIFRGRDAVLNRILEEASHSNGVCFPNKNV